MEKLVKGKKQLKRKIGSTEKSIKQKNQVNGKIC